MVHDPSIDFLSRLSERMIQVLHQAPSSDHYSIFASFPYSTTEVGKNANKSITRHHRLSEVFLLFLLIHSNTMHDQE